jgi:hypothetical protein
MPPLSRTSHSSSITPARAAQSAMTRTVKRRPVAGPNQPSPVCVPVEMMRCEDRKPAVSSPDQITSSP